MYIILMSDFENDIIFLLFVTFVLADFVLEFGIVFSIGLCSYRFIVRVMCSVLGLHVRQNSPHLRDKTSRLYICNHVTHFDHNIINLLTSCNTVSVSVCLSVFPAWCNLCLLLPCSALDLCVFQFFYWFTRTMRSISPLAAVLT